VGAWSPLHHGGDLFQDKVLKSIAAKHNKTVAQIAIKFQAQRGVVVIPKSSKKERIVENFDIFDFELTKEDLFQIAKLDKGPAGRYGKFEFVKNHPYYPFNEPY